MNTARAKEICISLAAFFVPENRISLKLIFDNVRNYGIIAALFLLSDWLSRQNAYPTSAVVSAVGLGGVKFAGVCTFVAMVLFLCNFVQSVILVVWILRPVHDFSALFEPLKRSNLNGWKRFGLLIWSLIRMWAVLAVVLVLVDFAVAVTKFAVVSGIK